MAAAAAVATLIGLTAASPAMADDEGPLWHGNRGTVKFEDDGDDITVCDKRADGAGVTGYLERLNADGNGLVYVIKQEDGGDAGCNRSDNDYDMRGNISHGLRICWNGDGSCTRSNWFFDE
ncbi:hypothetical protein [Streptomyces europaeiscabiei]|uniref:hypothetical protein n=1 Tax=Streptomyces europaeiscabiei TaxID=146819 RepID=UPI002E11C243|nr:hypothetical protein OHB30_19595 [Streptomyces europaeiscabiei]